jgi:hypothetical protein
MFCVTYTPPSTRFMEENVCGPALPYTGILRIMVSVVLASVGLPRAGIACRELPDPRQDQIGRA